MIGHYRIPTALLFKDPMKVEEDNSSIWNIFRVIFNKKKCLFVDLTKKVSNELEVKSIKKITKEIIKN